MTPDDFKTARSALGLSQTDMAEALGVGFRTVQRIEADGCSVAMGMAVGLLSRDARAAAMRNALKTIVSKLDGRTGSLAIDLRGIAKEGLGE